MTIDIEALAMDMSLIENIDMAQDYVPLILNELSVGPKTLDELYVMSYDGKEMFDIPLYLALHNLCKVGLIKGPDPYSDNSPHDHRLMRYSRAF